MFGKDVRVLVRQGYYRDKPIEVFKADAIAWAGDFDGIGAYFDKLWAQPRSYDTMLDLLCDYANNSLLC